MIGKVIKRVFDTDNDLYGLFKGRVYPLVGAQGAQHPFAIYEVSNNNAQSSKDSDSHLDELSVRITVVSESYTDAQNAVAYIRGAFVRTRVVVDNVRIQSCSFDGERDLFSDNERVYSSQIDLDFRVAID